MAPAGAICAFVAPLGLGIVSECGADPERSVIFWIRP
jgi:hypothetical protein